MHRTRKSHLLIVAGIVFTGGAFAALFGAGCSSTSELAAPENVGVTSQALSCDYSVLTAHNNNQRTGLQSCETVLTPQTVSYLQQTGEYPISGELAGQPLLVSGNSIAGAVRDAVIVVANPGTTSGNPVLLALHPETLAVISSRTLPLPFNCTWAGCYGVSSTPVIDKAANVVYLVNQEIEQPSGAPVFSLRAYDLNTFNDRGSAVISGSCTQANGTQEAFNPAVQRQRPALLLDHGHVYVAFGSRNEETALYNGWIFSYNLSQSGALLLTRTGNPYCSSRTTQANLWGRGGIWQLGAGISADPAGNVYAATGNGNIANTSNDDGQSYIKVAGATWTGTLAAKHLTPQYDFLAKNELEGSTGPVILPGPSGNQRVLGGNKQGLLTVLNASTMAVVRTGFRGAWHQYGPILGHSDVTKREPGGSPDVISCTSSTGCLNGIPSSSGNQNCCPAGCTADDACFQLIHGSHPHIHGQPSYLPNAAGTAGKIFWWGEKDYPRFMNWSVSQGDVVPVSGATLPVDKNLNRVSTDPLDLAPNNPQLPVSTGTFGYMMGGMAGGMTSLSANGVSNAVLWANTPQDGGCLQPNCTDRPEAKRMWLKAFDTATLPKKHVLRLDLGNGQYFGYPTVANGYVYVATKTKVVAYSTRPSSRPRWTTLPGLARDIGSGWAIGTNPVGNGDFGIHRYSVETNQWSSVSGGAQTISVDLNGTPWVVNNAGQIFKWNGTAWNVFGGAGTLCATTVASGSTDTETWALRCGDKTIWRWTGSAWSQVAGAADKITVFPTPDPTCGDHLPVALGTNGVVAFYQHSGCSSGAFNVANGAGSDLTTEFAVGTDGNIHRWNAATSTWSFYITSPWGANTKIGAWANGLFARDTVSGEVKVISTQL